MFRLKLIIFYFTVYSLINYTFIHLVRATNLLVSNIVPRNVTSYPVNLMISLNLMSIARLPPFTGFFIKISIIVWMTNNLIILTLIILFSLISIVYYTRMLFVFMINQSNMLKVKNNTFINPQLFTLRRALGLNLLTPIVISC